LGVKPLAAIESAPTSRTDWVTDRVRRAVLFGEVKAGERLISGTWATRLGVSATPLREALHRLAAEGLVDYDPHFGARVAPLSTESACEIYELRITLEPGAVESSVRSGDDAWRRELEYTFAQLHAIYDAVDFGKAQAHRAFHQTIRARCGSVWLLRIVDMLADQSTRLQLSFSSARGGAPAALQEHRDLFSAAKSGNASLAAELTAEHLRRSLEALRMGTTTS